MTVALLFQIVERYPSMIPPFCKPSVTALSHKYVSPCVLPPSQVRILLFQEKNLPYVSAIAMQVGLHTSEEIFTTLSYFIFFNAEKLKYTYAAR